MKKIIDENLIKKIRKLWDNGNGISQENIAQRLGVKQSAISKALAKKITALLFLFCLLSSSAAADNFTLPSTLGACAAIADGDIYSNISGGNACATANTLSATFDHDLGNAQGDILYRNATGWTVLAPGTSGNFLETQGAGANPIWGAAGTGTVTSITAGTGITLSPSPITTSGSVSISNTAVTAGSYTNANITVNAQGQLTAASNGTGAAAVFPYWSIAGDLPTAISGSSTTAAVTISSGQAADSTNASLYTSAGFSWAVSNGNAANGYQGGTTLPNSSTIHFYLLAKSTDTTWTASFASTSLTPTLPAAYSGGKYRHIFALQTNSSGALIPALGYEYIGGSIIQWLTTQVLDFHSTVTTSCSNITLSVPSGIKLSPLVRNNTDSGNYAILLSGDETCVAPTSPDFWTTAPGYDVTRAGASVSTSLQPFLITNTSGQIQARATAASTDLNITTRGWIDYRRY